MGLLVVAILLKIVILYLLAGLRIGVDTFVFIYNPATALFFGFSLWKKGISKDKLFFILALDTFLPIFGFFSLAIYQMLSPIFKLISAEQSIDTYDLPFGEEEFEYYSEVKTTLLAKESPEEQTLQNETLDLEPYMEIFHSDDLAKKVNAIEKLTEIGDTQCVKILKKCLDIDDYEVRYFANSALEKIEQDMMSKIEIARENVARHPMDYVAFNGRASSYLDAYLLGILDRNSETHFLESALMDFLSSLSLKENQSYLYVKIMQIYLKLEQYDNLISQAKMALKANLTKEDETKIKFYLAEAYFALGQYDKVVSYCRDISEFDTGFSKINESMKWWLNESA